MATHEIKADLDVDGEVQGTSLDINGNADISGQLLVQNGGPQLVLKDTTDDDDQQIQFMNNSGGIDYKIYTTDFTSGGGADGLYIGSTGSDEVGLVTNNTTALTLDTSQNATFAGNVTLSGIILDGNTITGVDDSGEFTDNDAHIMTSAGINDRFAQINANTTGSSGSCTGNSATATDATNLNATDDRDMAPEDYGYSNDFRIFFTSKEGLEDGSSTSGNWMDALYLNSYSDASGHDANLLAFDKSTKAIYHYQADQAASNWGTAKQLAYTDSDISGDTTGTAAIATTITVADESSDTSCNVLFATAATGNLAPKSGTNLTFNSSSGVLTATGFAGALTGNVTGNASGSSGSCTGNSATATALTSGDKTISGNVTINGFVLDGNTITGIDDSGEFTDNDSHIMTSAGINDKFAVINANTTGSSGSCTGNAATATEATNITATANNSANETVYLTFVDGATGTQGIETDTGLSYNPSTGALTTNSILVGAGITHDGDINNKIAFTTDTQTFSCDGNESLILRGNAVNNEPLLEINGAGAGNQLNIGLLLKGVTNGNPIKMKMQAPPDGGGSAVGAGILSYEPDADTFNIGQSTSHGSMAISINNDDIATFTNAATLSGGFVLDGNTITGVDDSGEFTNDDAHIMTSAGVEDKILGYGYTTNTGDATLSGTQTFSGAKTFSAAVTVSNSTASTSKTTGAVKVTGGVGIQGALNVGADVTAFASSDRRYKDNLQAITNPIDKVKSLTGYTFTWNDKHEQFNGNNDIGVVAQEVEKVLPEIVDTRDNGYKAVKYEKMVALLIEAVKDQQKQIDELKEKCNGCS